MDNEALPGQLQQPGEIMCHNCGRFVGPQNKCPHCGAPIHKRLSLRFFRAASLLLAVIGVFLLWLMVANRELPVLEIGSIKRSMNFAFVSVEGKVIGDSRVVRESGRVVSVGFVVDDGTGELSVKAYRAKARELVELDLVPRSGDRVVVAGSLNVAEDDMALWIASPDRLEIDRAELVAVRIADVTAELDSRIVVLRGLILSVDAPKMDSRAPWSLKISDGTGIARLTIWQDTFEAIGAGLKIQAGATFKATAQVVDYRGTLQYQLNRYEDFEMIEDVPSEVFREVSSESDKVYTTDELSEQLLNQLVTVRGQVHRFRISDEASRKTDRIVLAGATRKLPAKFSTDVSLSLDRAKVVKGRTVEIQGYVVKDSKGLVLAVYHSSQIQWPNP